MLSVFANESNNIRVATLKRLDIRRYYFIELVWQVFLTAMPLGNETITIHARGDPVRPFDAEDFLLNDVEDLSVNSVFTIAPNDALLMFV